MKTRSATGATSREGVFSAGDCVTGPDLVVTATGGEELRLSAGTIVIDTGARPAEPPIPGLAGWDTGAWSQPIKAVSASI